MATSTARRRAALIARGQPDPVLRAIGRQVRLARERLLTGTPRPDVPVGRTGIIHHQREFRTVEAALRWGQNNLPPNDSAYLMARGTLREASGERAAGQRTWVGLTEWTRARYLTRQIRETTDELHQLLTDYTQIVLRWRSR